jgi:hypothetical protein
MPPDSTSTEVGAEKSDMHALLSGNLLWWLVALAVAGVAAGIVRWHRLVVSRFARLAARRGGKLSGASWLLFPRVEWRLDGTQLIVSLNRDAEEDAHHDVRTMAYIACPGYPNLELELRRIGRRPSDVEAPGTRDAAFESAFRWATNDPRLARALLDDGLRRSLLAFDAGRDVGVRLGEVEAPGDGRRTPVARERRLEVSVTGVPADIAVLEDLVDLARALHERLSRAGSRRAA